jgi:hypothetical protein
VRARRHRQWEARHVDEEVARTQAEIYDVFIGEFAGALTGIYADRPNHASLIR